MTVTKRMQLTHVMDEALSEALNQDMNTRGLPPLRWSPERIDHGMLLSVDGQAGRGDYAPAEARRVVLAYATAFKGTPITETRYTDSIDGPITEVKTTFTTDAYDGVTLTVWAPILESEEAGQ